MPELIVYCKPHWSILNTLFLELAGLGRRILSMRIVSPFSMVIACFSMNTHRNEPNGFDRFRRLHRGTDGCGSYRMKATSRWRMNWMLRMRLDWRAKMKRNRLARKNSLICEKLLNFFLPQYDKIATLNAFNDLFTNLRHSREWRLLPWPSTMLRR